MMKICSIGNSFSQDAHKWLHKLAKENGIEAETVNLVIGGCSLQMHWNNVENNSASYGLEVNGNPAERMISMEEALKMDQWDIVTIQQVSWQSGMPQTYEPYLSRLAGLIRSLQPAAKLYFHQTWAYETDSGHDGFVLYRNDQAEMYRCIQNASNLAAQAIHAEMIPAGRVIQTLRETVPEFDYQNGGASLCRDGFHMSFDYGRFAVAATWLRTLTGVKVEAAEFEDFDPLLLKKILAVVNDL